MDLHICRCAVNSTEGAARALSLITWLANAGSCDHAVFCLFFSLGSSWLVHWFIFSVSTAIFGIYNHVWKYGKTDGLKILLFDLETLKTCREHEKNAVLIRVLDRSDRLKKIDRIHPSWRKFSFRISYTKFGLQKNIVKINDGCI